MSCFKRFKKIKNLDIFSQPNNLFVNGNSEFSTIFGGIVSLIIVVTFSYLVFITGYSFLSRKNLEVTTILKYEDNPGKVELKFPDFMFAVGFNNPNVYISSKKYFTINFQYRDYYINETSGKRVKKKVNVDLEKCTIEHFKGYEKQFKAFNLQNYDCPKKEQIFELEGTYTSSRFSFLRFEINKCVNSDNCASWSEIYEYFNNYGI